MKFSFYMVCLWLFIIIGRPQDIFPWLKIIHPGDITAGLAIASFFLSGTKRKPISPELKLFFLLFFIAFLCTPFGYYPKRSLAYLYGFFGKVSIFLYLISNVITDEKRITTIIHTVMLGGFAMALFTVAGKIAGAGRIGGGATYDANDLAMVMVVTLPIAIVELFRTESRSWKIICIIGSMFCLATIIATQSRGGLLGLAVIGMMFFLGKGMPIPKGKVLLVLAILGVVFLSSLSTEYKERIETILEENLGDMKAGSGRILIWRRALIISADNPLLGVGPGCFVTAYGDYLTNDKFPESLYEEKRWGGWKTAHNSYLLVLVELGIPGLIVYLSIIIRSIRNLNSLTKQSLVNGSSPIFGQLATGLKISLYAFLISVFFLSQAHNITIYLYCILSGEMLRMVCPNHQTADRSS